jgi:kinesin family protein 2/24
MIEIFENRELVV